MDETTVEPQPLVAQSESPQSESPRPGQATPYGTGGLRDVLGKKELPLTLFVDVDGTILEHYGSMSTLLTRDAKVLDGVVKKFDGWYAAGYRLIVVTGRPEPMRELTKQQLAAVGIAYHQLVMDVGIGARVLVNDLRPGDDGPTAAGAQVVRNAGLEGLEF